MHFPRSAFGALILSEINSKQLLKMVQKIHREREANVHFTNANLFKYYVCVALMFLEGFHIKAKIDQFWHILIIAF